MYVKRMMSQTVLSGSLMILLLLPSASIVAASGKTAKKDSAGSMQVLRSQRFDLYIAGQPSGQLVSRDLRNAEGNIELLRESHMHLRRGEMELHINSQSLTVLDASGQALRFSSRRDDATGTMRIRGVLKKKAGASHSAAMQPVGPELATWLPMASVTKKLST